MSLILRIIFDACTPEQSANLYSEILSKVYGLNKEFRREQFRPYWKIENSYESLFILDSANLVTIREIKEKLFPGSKYLQASEIIWDRNREPISNTSLMPEVRWIHLEVIE
ncbi:hypothetical protein [Candidatus Odyssella acanthamoebae]|uniref:Uncharacterized protein n=1 Tax=Candidatus Odyssella acanthamoebae TaxID=91604 RepID=A0A077B2H0_9PROT|nr:hypothetical protein [Candidatus Paracaedibacter acanthamoebae]AIK97195.1 hypothetical protein ID47_11335 [Candidatus Paracaedibacter acanthamoebae]